MDVFDYNGGTIIGMSGKNCVAIATDRRYGKRFTTVDTQRPKIFKFGPTLFLGVCGLATDVNTVQERMKFRTNLYELEENRKLKPGVFANMLSGFLYQNRFGPYFVSPIVVGLDPQSSEPFIFESDMIGCTERKPDFAIGGTANEQCCGLAEQYWKKDMSPDELFEAISQTLLNGFDRDAYSGWGADVYIVMCSDARIKPSFSLRDQWVIKNLPAWAHGGLPPGWCKKTHASGMPLYLHLESQVVTFSKPYRIGTADVLSHRIPVCSIPCLYYNKLCTNEPDCSLSVLSPLESHNAKPSDRNDNSTEICQFDVPITASENSEIEIQSNLTQSKSAQLNLNPPISYEVNAMSNNTADLSTDDDVTKFNVNPKCHRSVKAFSLGSLSPDELREFCSKRFEFASIKCRHFQRFADKCAYIKNEKCVAESTSATTPSVDRKRKHSPSLNDTSIALKQVYEKDIPVVCNTLNENNLIVEITDTNRTANREDQLNSQPFACIRIPIKALNVFSDHPIQSHSIHQLSIDCNSPTPIRVLSILVKLYSSTGTSLNNKDESQSRAAQSILKMLYPNLTYWTEILLMLQNGITLLSASTLTDDGKQIPTESIASGNSELNCDSKDSYYEDIDWGLINTIRNDLELAGRDDIPKTP